MADSIEYYAHESAEIINLAADPTVKIYKGVRVVNCTLNEYVSIGDFTLIQDSELEANINIQRNNTIYSSKIGRYSYTGRNTHIWYAQIGSFCSISWGVGIGGANHDYSKITTHAFLYSKDFGLLSGEPLYDRFTTPCTIGNDVWIGANAIICRNVVIGNGAIIGAGAVVTKNVAPYTIVVGAPAKPIKKRFSDDVIIRLQKCNWWNLPKDIIRENIDLFNSIPTSDVLEKMEDLCRVYGTCS